jgi:hypothetical protein
MSKYLGKWQALQENPETGLQILDVVEVNGNEVKAVGSNLTLAELLNNYKRFDQKALGIVDPFALPSDATALQEFQIDEEFEDTKEDKPLHTEIDLTNTETVRIANSNTNTFVNVNKSYSAEELLIIKMVEVMKASTSKKSSTDVMQKLNIAVDLPFSIDRIIASGQLVGLQRADVVKILRNNFDEIFDTSSLLTALKNSIQSVIEDLSIETSDGNS